jgi:hypothetical protein
MNRSFTTLVLALCLTGPTLPALAETVAKPDPDTAWRQEVETFRKERFESLKKEDGWFTLVGLAWLDEGENRFGSDPGNKVVLPEGKSPAVAGVLVRKGDKVSVRVEPGAKVTSGGQPIAPGSAMDLVSDMEGKPTVLEMGPVSFFVIRRTPTRSRRPGASRPVSSPTIRPRRSRSRTSSARSPIPPRPGRSSSTGRARPTGSTPSAIRRRGSP